MRPYKVYAIEEGTVIDHIPAGMALRAINVLGLLNEHKDKLITVGMNMESKKSGFKDIIKIEKRELTQEQSNKIALLAPNATVNIIRKGKVHKKHEVKVPQEIIGIAKCANPNCITNKEEVKTKFHFIKKEPLTIQCNFCERKFRDKEIIVI